MDSFYNPLDLQFFAPRYSRKLTRYAFLLNEASNDKGDDANEEPCPLATELLPHLFQGKENEDDLVGVFGEILKGRIITHSEVDQVAILKPDEILANNDPMLVPVMYRIAAENFAQTNKSLFKIIECRNVTKLISDWKPSLPDKLIALGHQVIVVQLETSFVPYTDFAYAVLRQLDYDWKKRLPRSFFFPDDVCKVEATYERDLCVVSPSMPDGDLEINKKMGLLNYELLMMIKSSCMSAMKNYLMKRDLRVGKFSDTLDGVSALRQLYRKLQEKLRTGEDIELSSNSMEDLKKLAKQSVGGADVLAAQTWIEYGKRIGLDIPASASSSATSISSARSIIEKSATSNDDDDGDLTDEENDEDNSGRNEGGITSDMKDVSHTSSSEIDKNDGKDHQMDGKENSPTTNSPSDEIGKEREAEENDNDNCLEDSQRSDSQEMLKAHQQEFRSTHESRNLDGRDQDDEDFHIETFVEFKDSLEKMNKRKREIINDTVEDDDDDLSLEKFSAESILQILQFPKQQMELLNQ